MLSVDTLERIEALLTRERAGILESLGNGDPRHDEASGALVALDRRMDALAATGPLKPLARSGFQTSLRRIDAAMARIRAGTFGQCSRCDYPIEKDRLTANPSTPFCLPCFEEILGER